MRLNDEAVDEQRQRLLPFVTRLACADTEQVEAVERALETEVGCSDVLQLVASIRGAVNGLTVELMEDHILMHVVDPAHEPDPDRARGAEELIEVMRTYLRLAVRPSA